jgi:hypothetical protein
MWPDFANIKNITKTIVSIICPIHGIFQQRISDHKSGCGCRQCGKIKQSDSVKNTKPQLISICQTKHKNYYDYSLWGEDVTSQDLVQIGCPLHGVFQQRVSDHKNGSGCHQCGKIKQTNSKKRTNDHFIALCISQHGNRYDYSLLKENVGRHDLVDIICPVHGIFQQRLNSHITGNGCNLCADIHRGEKCSKGREYFIEVSSLVHHFKYDYSLIPTDVRSTHIVNITCPMHGLFSQEMNSHRRGAGCNKCKSSTMRKTMFERYGVYNAHQTNIDPEVLQLLEKPEWLINQHHENKKSITTIAKDIGVEPHVIYNRLRRFNIEAKYYFRSAGEGQICDLMDDFGIQYIGNSRDIITPYELDIYIPSSRLAIEYCGIYWHSEQQGKDKDYHKTKMDMCNKKGIQLLTIFEDEWFSNQQQIKDHITNICIQSTDVIPAGDCDITLIDCSEASQFINMFSIQQYIKSGINYALIYNDNIVGCISLNETGVGVYEITQLYVFDCIVDGMSSLINHLQTTHMYNVLNVTIDLRWYTPSKFIKLGFVFDKNIEPDYTLSIGNKVRTNKDEFLSNLPKYLKNYDDTLSDEQNCENHNILRIWDCGHAVLRKTIDISKHPA